MKEHPKRAGQAPDAPPTPKMPVVGWVVLAGVLVACAGLLWLTVFRNGAGRRAEVPADLNVLLITVDTTRADALGCYGRANARTPNLDRIAREGTRFGRCSACSPLTAPSHCTIMTATYPFVHRVRQNGFDHLVPASITLAEILRGEGFTTHAIVASFVLRGIFGLSQGFETYLDVVTAKGMNPAAAERKADEVCNEAIARLGTIAAQRFFFWVHFYDPHYPYESPRGASVESPEAYADEVAFMETQIGRLLGALRDLGLEGKTLLILVGDHGEGLGDHGESEHGYFVYETTMHVPLMVWCPGMVPAGAVVEAQVRTVDIAPTILDYVGLPPPDRFQGTSLRPLIDGDVQDLDLAAYGEATSGHVSLGMSMVRSLHDGGWKYIHSPRPQLYHVESDYHEWKNRAAEEPQRLARMRQQLWSLLANAPPPPGEEPTTTQLSAEDVEGLRSLGYVGPTADAPATPSAELASFEPVGPDPADHTQTIDRYVRAHRLMSKGQLTDAEDLLRQVVWDLPASTGVLTELARALRKQDRADEIFDVCERILAANPSATETRLFYARRLMRARAYETAIGQLNTLLAQDPLHIEAHLEMANALRALERLDESLAQYEKALELDPQNSSLLHGLALLYKRQGKLAEAADCLRKAIEIDPKSARLQRDLQRVLEAGEP